jgi:hypothetical protein
MLRAALAHGPARACSERPRNMSLHSERTGSLSSLVAPEGVLAAIEGAWESLSFFRPSCFSDSTSRFTGGSLLSLKTRASSSGEVILSAGPRGRNPSANFRGAYHDPLLWT